MTSIKRHDRRRFHQLFHHPARHETRKSKGVRMSTSCSTICGTIIWSIGDLQNRVNDLLHGGPLYTLLRQHLKQRCWPPGCWCLPNVLPGVHRKVPGTSRLGEGIFRNTARTAHLAPLPWPLPSSVCCGAEWWVISARAIATLIRSCLMNWRKPSLPPSHSGSTVAVSHGPRCRTRARGCSLNVQVNLCSFLHSESATWSFRFSPNRSPPSNQQQRQHLARGMLAVEHRSIFWALFFFFEAKQNCCSELFSKRKTKTRCGTLQYTTFSKCDNPPRLHHFKLAVISQVL